MIAQLESPWGTWDETSETGDPPAVVETAPVLTVQRWCSEMVRRLAPDQESKNLLAMATAFSSAAMGWSFVVVAVVTGLPV